MAASSSIDLDQDPRVIVGIREFDAPRALVFSVWTDPKHLAQWWGPYGFTTTTHSFDLRPGGVQLELAGSADAPVSGTGSVIDMRFKVVAPRPAASIDTQVVLLGADGVAVAATAATPLKMAFTQ